MILDIGTAISIILSHHQSSRIRKRCLSKDNFADGECDGKYGMPNDNEDRMGIWSACAWWRLLESNLRNSKVPLYHCHSCCRYNRIYTVHIKYIAVTPLRSCHLSMKALSSTGAIRPALQRCHVPGSIDAFHPSDDFIDRVPQCIRRCDRFVPDRVLPGFAIEMPLSIDVNVEFESDVAIRAREYHAIRYRSSPDFSASDRLETFEYFIEYVHRCIFRRRWRRWWGMRFWIFRHDEYSSTEFLNWEASYCQFLSLSRFKILETRGYILFYKGSNYSDVFVIKT